jgi:hypothetical protein
MHADQEEELHGLHKHACHQPKAGLCFRARKILWPQPPLCSITKECLSRNPPSLYADQDKKVGIQHVIQLSSEQGYG